MRLRYLPHKVQKRRACFMAEYKATHKIYALHPETPSEEHISYTVADERKHGKEFHAFCIKCGKMVLYTRQRVD